MRPILLYRGGIDGLSDDRFQVILYCHYYLINNEQFLNELPYYPNYSVSIVKIMSNGSILHDVSFILHIHQSLGLSHPPFHLVSFSPPQYYELRVFVKE